MTGNSPLFRPTFGLGIAEKWAILSLFGTVLGPGGPSGPLEISHFHRGRKSFIMRYLQVVSDKMYYVNKSCRIEYGGKGV